MSGRILLCSSAGGVLLDLLSLQPWWSRHEAVWAAVRAADTEALLVEQRVLWIRERSVRRPLGIVPALGEAWRIMREEKPSLVVSAGSGPAVAFFVVSRLLGIPTFWVSTLNLVTTPGIAARICARLASVVLLQHETIQSAHPRGIVIGQLY